MNSIIKSTFLLAAAILLLTSCAQEVLPDNGSTAIKDRRIVFRTSLPELTSRANEIASDLPHFFMTAFDETDFDEEGRIENDTLKVYFCNEEIAKASSSDNYYSNNCIWPDPGHEKDQLHFFAYYPELNRGALLVNGTSVSGRSIDYKINNFEVARDIAEQVDFVTAYATGNMADNLFSGIQLNFGHQLSRIEIKAWGANKSCDIEIAGVRIGGVNVKGNFDFKPSEGTSVWSGMEKGTVEHIFLNEEVILLSSKENSHATSETAASIMGAKIGDENNCAMLIPSSDENGWDFEKDHTNTNKGMYISVLLRVIDKTPGGNNKQQYPYNDNSQGLNAMNIQRVYLAVDGTGKVTANPGQLYKDSNGKYYTDYTDEENNIAYSAPQGSTVKEFGWAALPVTGNWEPGYTYSYTLNYTSGVGLHDPNVKDPQSGLDSAFPGPKAGDPIISDRVGVTVSVNGWQGGERTTHDFEVPGS